MFLVASFFHALLIDSDSIWRRPSFVDACLTLLARNAACYENECGDALLLPQLLSIAAAEPPVSMYVQTRLMDVILKAMKRDSSAGGGPGSRIVRYFRRRLRRGRPSHESSNERRRGSEQLRSDGSRAPQAPAHRHRAAHWQSSVS